MSVQLLASESGVAFNPLLSMILLPLIGAAVLTLIPKSRGDVFKQVAISFAALSGALSFYLVAEFDQHEAGFQFVSNSVWVKSLGISWHLGVDGISLFLLALTGLLFPIAIA
ncbi:MAG TPA: Fe-S-binding domain-containing protein, partial [Microthrixaceae bacterium]|nr:Fe-S-binding domain-containing protein [Microthrixaceae bacterium]